MYCPDTLERLNEEAVRAYRESKPDCEFCDKKADSVIPVYNPADALLDVEGAYCTVAICNDCAEHGLLDEQYFYCIECGELFIRHHSWDGLVTIVGDEEYCQKCALDVIEPVTLQELLNSLFGGLSDLFIRINTIPGKTVLWSDSFSVYDGDTLSGVAEHIQGAAEELDLDQDTLLVYPVIDQGGQFGVSLAVYY